MKNKIVILSTLFLAIFGCSVVDTEQMTDAFNQELLKSSNRLNFESYEAFQNALIEISESNEGDKRDIIEKYTKIPKEFHSLKKMMESSATGEGLNPNHRNLNYEVNHNSELLSEMIPDVAFSELLNEQLEIEVENTVFKITEFGTFFSSNENVENLFSSILNFEQSDLEDLRGSRRINGRIEQNIYDDAYALDGDIYLIDTYYDIDFDEDLTYSSPVNASSNQVYQLDYFCGPCAPSKPTALPKAEYDKFQVHSFGAQTAVGKLIEGAFGTNTSFVTNFSSNYRLKVKLYAYNYGVYKSVGLNGKMQKKGWTGLWAKHDDSKATKLVLGWDALLLSLKIPYAMPINYQQLNSKVIAKEILRFSNFNLESTGLNDVTIPFFDRKSNDWNFLEKALNKNVQTSLANLTKLVWQEAEQEFSKASYDIKQAEIKHYRKIFPDKIKMMLSRVETSQSNSNEISFVIDRHFQIDLNFSSNANTLAKQILEPTLKNSKKMYEIDGASVFGAAIFNGQTKGIRIIKELE
ncbi:hypothetical protein ACFOUP_18245 [Belliella kenyensis]|uniref:DUF4856 domain-containing protein n=1 Tax=Belliella kenyensis TaxID=1472724 RepID=A0ABV8ERK6_9BACT|nr:hypothetical protein [Belliella kenyensis]MCH7402278.1 hypothetical protein [Belliella kenyensis]MDN3601794.1 hypothetical protein [Belliella kenyensis]